MRAALYVAMAVVTGSISGCASISAEGRTASGRPTVYAGTRLALAALNEDSARLSTYGRYGVEAPANPMFDTPLSFAFDTVALPMDAWYWATDEVGLDRPTWSGLLFNELQALADSTSAR